MHLETMTFHVDITANPPQATPSETVSTNYYMTSSNAMVDKEPEGMVKPLPLLRPFDISILLDHMLGETAWRSPLKRIGFDVAIITSNKNANSPVLR